MLGKISLLGTFVFLVFLSCHFNSFPTAKEVDMVFIQYHKETDYLKKTNLIKDLLKRLSATETVEDDKIIQYAISKLINEYKSTEDEAILVAVDTTKIEGGFANFTCQFYKALKQNRKFIQRCQNDPAAMKAFRRCLGITLSEEDVISVSQQRNLDKK
jgi:peptide subunit release factor 1 (eRF1)